MLVSNNDYDLLLARVKDLEKKIEYLRVSRRVLMNLVIQLEREKEKQISRLLEENRRLQRNNARYAQRLWLKNKQSLEMQYSTPDSG